MEKVFKKKSTNVLFATHQFLALNKYGNNVTGVSTEDTKHAPVITVLEFIFVIFVKTM